MVGSRTCVVILSLLVVAGTAAATTGTLDAEVALPVETDGETVLQGHEGALLFTGDDGELDFEVEGMDGTLTRVLYRSFGYMHPDDPRAEVVWGERYEEHPIDVRDGTLRLLSRNGDFRLLGYDADIAVHSASAPVGIATSSQEVDHQLPAVLRMGITSGEEGFRHVLPASQYHSQAWSGTAASDGPLRLFAVDGTFELVNAGEHTLLQAHPRVEERPGRLYNPLDGTWFGGGTHEEHVHEYIILEAPAAAIEATFAGTPAASYAPRVSVDVVGAAELYDVQGTLSMDDEEQTHHRFTGQDVRLDGVFTLDMHGAQTATLRTPATGDGDFTIVRYGAVQHEYDWTTAAAAATLGTLLLAGAVWLGSHAKALLGGAGATGAVAGYARVQGSKVLEHPGRGEVYERVKAHPGISMAELARAVPFGESTLNYHLRVLVKNEFLTQVRDGRYVRFFDRQSGLYASDRKHAVSALQNHTTQRIAQAIRSDPGLAQRELAERFGVAASTVNWHIRRLSQVGLVDCRRDHPHTRYYPGEAWASLPTDAAMAGPTLA